MKIKSCKSNKKTNHESEPPKNATEKERIGGKSWKRGGETEERVGGESWRRELEKGVGGELGRELEERVGGKSWRRELEGRVGGESWEGSWRRELENRWEEGEKAKG